MDALRADLTPDGQIRLEGEIGAGLWVRRIIGAKAIRDGSWQMPASLDSCVELRKHGVAFSETLTACEARADKVRRYIESVKRSETVEPLKPVPIKAPYSLYQHQIKAYNIALALFGRGASKKGESNAQKG